MKYVEYYTGKNGIIEHVRVLEKMKKRCKKPAHKGRGSRHRYGKPK